MFFNSYKKTFLENNSAIYWGGETHDRIWDEGTMYLYFFVVLITFYYSWKCEKYSRELSRYRGKSGTRKKKFVESFVLIQLILLCIMGLRGSWVGMDTIVYSQTFESATSLSAIFNDGSTTEPLYKIIQFLLRAVFSSRYIAIFIFSSCIIYFVFNTIRSQRACLCLIISIPAFVCLYYYQSFNLIRITLAASFMLWKMPLLVDEKYKSYSCCILLATMMHYSSMVLFFPLLLLILYKRNRLLAYVGVICSILLIIMSTKILGDYISLINRYESYITGNESTGKVGLAFFIDYLPCICICYYIIRRKIRSEYADLMLCFTASAVIIRLLAYYITVAGRLSTHFMTLTIILLPYWLNYIRISDKRRYNLLLPVCVIWLLIRLHIYFMGYLSSDGIMPYCFFWNE